MAEADDPKRNQELRQKLLAHHVVNIETGCWLWTGTKDRDGHGVIKVDDRLLRVPRLAMHLWNGLPLAASFEVRHTCDTPPCFNPRHLELGRQVRVGTRRGRGRV